MAYYKIDGYWKRSHPLYDLYHGMIQRCYNPNHKDYKYYGGRGIHVVQRWIGDRGFDHFVKDMGERPEAMTLDRINTNRWYSPHNCRWATLRTQSINRRNDRNFSSGQTGVSWHKRSNLWTAYIDLPRTSDGKGHARKHLGYFHDLGDAINARKEAERVKINAE